MTEERGRQWRHAIETSERRRRSDDTIDAGLALKLRIPPEVEQKLKAEGRTPRWVNDVGSRLKDLTERDDYDLVEGVEPRTVNIDKKGDTVKSYLVSKRTDFIEDDRAKAEAKRRANEQAMLTNTDVETGQPIPGRYADKANKIVRDNRILE